MNLNSVHGNSNSNIFNGGLAVNQDNWIYYVDVSNEGYIYKVNVDGSEKTQINSDNSFSINVIDDWIYYINKSDSWNIYKIKTDGTGRTMLDTDKCNSINVVDDWIYFSNSFDYSSIYRIKIDGTEKTQLNKDESDYINVTGDWIYYSNLSQAGYTYKMSLDGTINDVECLNKFNYIEIVNERFYAVKHSFNMIKNKYWNYIHTAKMSESTILSAKELNADDCLCMNVVGNWIYFVNTSDSGCIYKMLIDGSEVRKLNDLSSESINIAGDWIYFISNDDFYRMHLEGADLEMVE